jgi:hypothetical protein
MKFVFAVVQQRRVLGSWALGRTMAQAVSRRPLTAEARFDPGSVHVRFVVDKVALGQVFLEVVGFTLSI